MTTNPFYNAAAALCYVIFVVTIMSIGSHFGGPDQEDNFLVPVGMLSLLVLSASTMAYIFFYQPVIMLLDGRRKDAVRLFLRTVLVFAGITLSVLVASFVIFE